MFSLPFLFPSCCHCFVYRVVRIVSDGCNQSSFVFFYVVFEPFGPPRLAVQKQDDQHEHTFSNYVRIRDVVQKTCLRRWTIGKSGERGSGISVLLARHDDDDDDDTSLLFTQVLCGCLPVKCKWQQVLCFHVCVYVCFCVCELNCLTALYILLSKRIQILEYFLNEIYLWYHRA